MAFIARLQNPSKTYHASLILYMMLASIIGHADNQATLISGDFQVVRVLETNPGLKISLNIESDQFAGDFDGIYLVVGTDLYTGAHAAYVDQNWRLSFDIPAESEGELTRSEAISVIMGDEIWSVAPWEQDRKDGIAAL